MNNELQHWTLIIEPQERNLELAGLKTGLEPAGQPDSPFMPKGSDKRPFQVVPFGLVDPLEKGTADDLLFSRFENLLRARIGIQSEQSRRIEDQNRIKEARQSRHVPILSVEAFRDARGLTIKKGQTTFVNWP